MVASALQSQHAGHPVPVAPLEEARRGGSLRRKKCYQECLRVTEVTPPPVRIVVPTYNRPDRLRRLLAHLARQTAGPYPTIVVDDGGAAPAAPVCAEFGAWVTCLRQSNAGPATARNAGVAAAPEDALICFTDDDCEPDPDWVRTLTAAQAGAEMRMVGGRVENVLTANPYAAASQAISSYIYDFYDRTDSTLRFFTSNNLCVRAADFRRLGGFDAAFPFAAGEDRDLGIRWREAGGTLVYCPAAVVGHAHDMTFAKFLRQQANYGRGARVLHGLMAKRAPAGGRFERLGFYAGMLSYPLRQSGRKRVAQSALIAVSQVALVWGYLRESLATRSHG